MIDKSLLKTHNIGKDGFTWWLGQVCEAKTWADNYPYLPVNAQKDLPGFKRRVKVSILGWHTSDKNELKSDELPWAYCLLPVTAGGGTGGSSESLNFTGGEWVFGFFLDGDEGQQPVIIGVLDKSTQNDWRDDVPPVRYEPFSGFSNKRTAPLTDQKKDGTVEKQPVGDASVKEGDTGVQRTKTEPKETVRLERGSSEDVRPKASNTRHENDVATGDMTAADNSEDRNPFGNTDKVMKRLSRIETFVKKHNGIITDSSTNKLFKTAMEREQKRAGRIIATDQKDRTEKIRAAALEATSKMESNIATFGKLTGMGKAKKANRDAVANVIDTFNKQIDKLPLNAGDFIKNSANKIISQPPCVTEAYTGALMGQTVAQLDGVMNSLMGPVNSALSAASGGDFPPSLEGTIGGLLSKGLGAFGGISINLDGIATFSTSYKKLMKGELPTPPTKIKDLTMLGGAISDIPSQVKDGNILENLAAAIPNSGSLVAGASNFLNKNSIFSTAINTDNLNMRSLGGLGAVTDTLNLAKNLPGFSELPGTTGQSVLNIAKSRLEEGGTIDAAVLAANVVYPGSGELVKLAFKNQIGNQRVAGGACETGPTSNGPPQIRIFGGNGNGATANAVVGPYGNILAVEVTRKGKGFTEIPFAVVYDNSGKGTGAIVKAELDMDSEVVDEVIVPGITLADGTSTQTTKIIRSYSLKGIDVVEPGSGYLSAPDGSVGGNGRKFADGNATMIKDKQGNYYQFEPGTGIKIPPGGTVYLPAGVRCMLPTSAVRTDGTPIVDAVGSTVVDYAAIQYMHVFDVSAGKIIPGPQGAEGKNKPGFGKGVDYRRAKEEGYSDADIRFFLEGDPSRGQRDASIGGYFVRHMNGAIGKNMQKLLDDPTWGQLPVMTSGGKKPGKIKSLQINLKKGYKGFAKVTDGSRQGAGPILSLRDAVTDRKISNILEFQTGNWLNQNADLQGNTEILKLFKDAELRAINGTPVEGHGRFGTASRQTWEQTKVGAEGIINGKKVVGGGQRLNINGESYRTLDPWRADLADGTRLTFRGVYNHNTGLSSEQLADPYNLQKNNYRYFVFDYEVEVYSTPLGYDYTQGIDTIKTKWYKLIDINFVTGTEDWFNGETVKKRCVDKAGRLFEMYITVCTYDDDQTEAIGHGLATNSEVQEIIKVPLPCNPEIIKDNYADYQKCRWYREKQGVKSLKGEGWGTIPGSERNSLMRKIMEIYNQIGDDDKTRFNDYHNAVPYPDARKNIDKDGVEYLVQRYLKHLANVRKGLTCEKEEYEVKQSKVVKNAVKGWKGPGVYLDLRSVSGTQTITLREVVDDSGVHHALEIPGVASVSEQGLNWGRTAKVVNNILGGRIYGPITSQTAAGVWVATENPPHIKKNDLPTNLRTNKIVMLEEMGDDFDDFGLSTNVGRFSRFNESPFTETTIELPSITKTRYKKCTPLTEEEYQKYLNDFNTVNSIAFECLRKDIWRGIMDAARKDGPIVLEQQYCDWAREYVEEVRFTFRQSKTIGYELPCGGEITAPREDPVTPPSGGDPKIVKPKQTKINTTGSGYTDRDTITIGGKEVPFETDPDGRIIKVGVPDIPVVDYPEVDIVTEFGAGADIETVLEVFDPPPDEELLPLEMVEVIDCVGKNIFIKES